MPETTCVRVPRNYGEKAVTLLKKMGLLVPELRIHRENDYLFLPLMCEPTTDELNELKLNLQEGLEVSKRSFLEHRKHQLKINGLLVDQLPSYVLASLPHAIDFVGDIAVVEISPELEAYKQVIGEALLKSHKRVRTVLAKSGAVSGVYRLRTFEVIGGEAKTETVHKEYGCVFHVDLAKAYFSPRLSFEHSRIASLVEEGETIVDMFAGVGPFSVLIAKKLRNVRVYAIDVNPDAFKLLKKNVAANRAEGRVKPVLGDARQITKERLKESADRVIMNLPEKAIEYVDAACAAIKSEGGVIHFYEFSNTPNPTETAITHLTEAVKRNNRRLEKILLARIVRGVAPFTYQIVVDAKIR